MKFILISLLAGFMAGHSLQAQALDDAQSFTGNNIKNVSYEPLSVTINGAGQVFLFYNDLFQLYDGQMLQVGRSYLMFAVPDRGYKFSGWNRDNTFTITSVEIDENTSPPITNIVTSVVVSPIPTLIKKPIFEFTMYPVELLYDDPGVRTITQSIGWEANFVPVVRKVRVETKSETGNGQ